MPSTTESSALPGNHEELLAEEAPDDREPKIGGSETPMGRKQAPERVREEAGDDSLDMKADAVEMLRNSDVGESNMVVGAIEVGLR